MIIPLFGRFFQTKSIACALPLAACLAVIATVAPAERLTQIKSETLPYDNSVSYAHAYDGSVHYLLGWHDSVLKLWYLRDGEEPETLKFPTPTTDEHFADAEFTASMLTGSMISVIDVPEVLFGEETILYTPISHNWVHDAILYVTKGGELHAFMGGDSGSYHVIMHQPDGRGMSGSYIAPKIVEIVHRSDTRPILHNATNGYVVVEKGKYSNIMHIFHDGRYRKVRQYPEWRLSELLDFPDLFDDGKGAPRKIQLKTYGETTFRVDRPSGNSSTTNEAGINDAIHKIEEKSGISGLRIHRIAGFDTETMFFALKRPRGKSGVVLARLIYRPDPEAFYNPGSFDVRDVTVIDGEHIRNLLVKPDGSVIYVGRNESEESYTRLSHLDASLKRLKTTVYPDDYRDFGIDEDKGYHDLRVRVLEDGNVSVTAGFHRDGVTRAMFNLYE